MILDWNKDDGKIGPARLFDANDVEYDHVLRCNTETGEIVILAADPQNANAVMVDDETCNVIREWRIFAPAPLRIEQIRKDTDNDCC